jgi:hypothetical protein
VGSGNVAVITQTFDNDLHPIAVLNDTCADFFVRVVFKAYPEPPSDDDAGARDAESDAGDAGDADAEPSNDASTDGASE